MSSPSKTLCILAALDIYDCNSAFQNLAVERIECLAKIKSCDVLHLTLQEAITCLEAASLDYNDLVPTLFPGSQSLQECEVREQYSRVLQ